MATVVVAAAVVRDGERLLLTKRPSGAHLEGLWEFPGGKLEEGEAPEAALVRECLEECGIDVVVEDILDVAFHRYPKKDVLLLFYACRLGARREVQHLEVVDHAWALPSELDRFELPPPDARLVAKLQRGVWVAGPLTP
jgi:8-oxo-dGTP diphosphatase